MASRSIPPRARATVLAAALLATLIPGRAPAQGPTVGYDGRFDASGINRRVFGVGEWNGDLYAGGPFRFLTGDGQPEHLARYDGRDWRDVGGGVNGPVRAIVEYGGELVVAGEFGLAGGNVSVNSIARWNGSRWAPLGNGLEYAYLPAHVFTLEVHQGELHAGGLIDTAGGRAVRSLARWDGTSWHPVGGGVSGNSTAKVLDLLSDGNELYVGGEFDHAGSVPAANVAAWNGTAWRAFGAGLGLASVNGVHALALYQGTVYAGGLFGGSAGTTLRRIARWDAPSGTWQPLGLGIPDGGRTSQVNALAVHGGELWVTGVFPYVDGANHGQGLHSPSVARWDGTQWLRAGGLYRATFGGDAVGICSMVWNGRLVIGGEFDHAGPPGNHAANVVSQNIIAWDGSGYEVLGEGLGLGDGTSGLLRWNGSLWSIENHHYAGAAVSSAVARFDGARWHTVGPFDPRTDIDDAIVFQGDLHVVGDLWFADGRRMAGVIRYDGTTWTSLGGPTGGTLAIHGGELYCGALGGVQRLSGGVWSRLPAMFGYVNTMLSHGGRLYIGGSSLRISTTGSAPNLLVWDGATLSPIGSGMDGAVDAMHVHGGELWIGGAFDTANGLSSPRLVRWNGSRFLAFAGPPITGPVVKSLESLGTKLFIGGDLGVVGGTRTTLARWDGTSLQALGTGPNSFPSDLLADEATGEVWVAGGFFLCDGITAAGLTIWHDEPLWEDLGLALPRSNGVTPRLDGHGDVAAHAPIAVRAAGFAPGEPALFVFGFQRLDVPLVGGTLVPAPEVTFLRATDPVGAVGLDLVLPAGLAPGVDLFAQVWSFETLAGEVSATNGVAGR